MNVWLHCVFNLLPACPQVRHELEQGHSVRYLLPDSVVRYIHEQKLYGTAGAPRPHVLHPVGRQRVDSDQD